MAQIEADLPELHPKPIDLAELAADAVEEAEAAAADKHITITLRTEGLLPLEADTARLRQAARSSSRRATAKTSGASRSPTTELASP